MVRHAATARGAHGGWDGAARAFRLTALVVLVVLLAAFAPRGSESIGYLAETSALVVLGTVHEAPGKSPAAASTGTVLALKIERVLKGRAPKGPLVIWIPSHENPSALEAGQRAILFLSPVPDLPFYRRAGVAGRRLWRIDGAAAGVLDPALEAPVKEMVVALRSGENSDVLNTLVHQAGNSAPRVQEDAIADLERRCQAGCALDAAGRARLRALGLAAPAGSALRKQFLRAAGENSGRPAAGGP
ncbi:MAG: hypothetical protein Q8R92_12710 [Deltaproteobacteria bacterium]|nr:hypothetical protein [Deltaproteobacteria bacterium]